MEEKSNKKNGAANAMMNKDASCTCNMCSCATSCGCGQKASKRGLYYLLRVLITVIIVFIVFWTGVAVGKMNSGNRMYMMNRGFYPGMMMDDHTSNQPMMGGLRIKDSNGPDQPMMPGQPQTPPPSSTPEQPNTK